jgi:MOSC domain-containing protein YiiM
VLTSGIDLNALVGRHFRVGGVECYGVELCEPCRTLEGMTRPGIVKAYVHRAGLNADILTDGEIRVGDAVRAEAESPAAA